MKKDDPIGNRIKFYEKQFTSDKLNGEYPIVCRLDGNNFSKFTNGLVKPFDRNFTELMVEVTKFAVGETGANIGYTQSDEITLIWYNENGESYHNGKVFKILSKLASKVSVRFNKLLHKYLPEKAHLEPIFDARVFNVPTTYEAFNSLLWRFLDAKKNSISSLFHYTFGHSESMYKNSKEKIEFLAEHDIYWNNLADKYKTGTFVKRVLVARKLTKDELKNLPEKHAAKNNPNLEFTRSDYKVFTVNYDLSQIDNKEEFIFEK